MRFIIRIALIVILSLNWATAQVPNWPPLEQKTITYQGAKFTVVSLTTGTNPPTLSTGPPLLRLYLNDPEGKPFGSFEKLNEHLTQYGRELVFAMNAGMFHRDQKPVGLTVIKGKTITPLNLKAGKGNFFLKPNGIFMTSESGKLPFIFPSQIHPKITFNPYLATQSGPLLVMANKFHPAINEDSKNKHIRNGVGVSKDRNTIHFVISDEKVTFHHLARLFRDQLNCPNALYLDGVISSIYSKELKRHDKAHKLGPIFAISKPVR